MNAIERKLVQKRLEALTAKLNLMYENGFEPNELEELKSEFLEVQAIMDKPVEPTPKEKTAADHYDEYLMKKYGTTDPEKIKAIEKPSDDLLESITAPEGGNPNSAGITTRRW